MGKFFLETLEAVRQTGHATTGNGPLAYSDPRGRFGLSMQGYWHALPIQDLPNTAAFADMQRQVLLTIHVRDVAPNTPVQRAAKEGEGRFQALKGWNAWKEERPPIGNVLREKTTYLRDEMISEVSTAVELLHVVMGDAHVTLILRADPEEAALLEPIAAQLAQSLGSAQRPLPNSVPMQASPQYSGGIPGGVPMQPPQNTGQPGAYFGSQIPTGAPPMVSGGIPGATPPMAGGIPPMQPPLGSPQFQPPLGAPIPPVPPQSGGLFGGLQDMLRQAASAIPAQPVPPQMPMSGIPVPPQIGAIPGQQPMSGIPAPQMPMQPQMPPQMQPPMSGIPVPPQMQPPMPPSQVGAIPGQQPNMPTMSAPLNQQMPPMAAQPAPVTQPVAAGDPLPILSFMPLSASLPVPEDCQLVSLHRDNAALSASTQPGLLLVYAGLQSEPAVIAASVFRLFAERSYAVALQENPREEARHNGQRVVAANLQGRDAYNAALTGTLKILYGASGNVLAVAGLGQLSTRVEALLRSARLGRMIPDAKAAQELLGNWGAAQVQPGGARPSYTFSGDGAYRYQKSAAPQQNSVLGSLFSAVSGDSEDGRFFVSHGSLILFSARGARTLSLRRESQQLIINSEAFVRV